MDLIKLRKYIQQRKIREKINIFNKYFIPFKDHVIFCTDDYVGFRHKEEDAEFCSFNLVGWKQDKYCDVFHGIHFRVNAHIFYRYRKTENDRFLSLLDHSYNYLKSINKKSELLFDDLSSNDRKYGKLLKLIDSKI